MTGDVVGWVLGVSAGEVLLFTSALGWFARRQVAALDLTRKAVHGLEVKLAETNVASPILRRDVDRLGEVVTENTSRIAVLGSWRDGHERWHERHDIRSAGD